MAMAIHTAAPPQVTPRPRTIITIADVVIFVISSFILSNYFVAFFRLCAWKKKLRTRMDITKSHPKQRSEFMGYPP